MDKQVFIERLGQLVKRVQGYPRHELLIELAVIWLGVYLVLRFLRGTRGGRAIKGMAMVLILCTISIKLLTAERAFERLDYLYSHFLTFTGLALVIVFQPELRRALVRLGEARLFLGPGLRRWRVIDEIVGAVEYLSKNKVGALIAIEREVGLKGIVEGGTVLDADVSKELLVTIFWPGSALHDMGVVIQGGRVVAAGVQFPLAEGDRFDSELGSRHRAAVGLSMEADALIIVVSEETGKISLGHRGKLMRGLTGSELRGLLVKKLARSGAGDGGEGEGEGQAASAV